jgi:hypothetical protein
MNLDTQAARDEAYSHLLDQDSATWNRHRGLMDRKASLKKAVWTENEAYNPARHQRKVEMVQANAVRHQRPRR